MRDLWVVQSGGAHSGVEEESGGLSKAHVSASMSDGLFVP